MRRTERWKPMPRRYGEGFLFLEEEEVKAGVERKGEVEEGVGVVAVETSTTALVAARKMMEA